MKNTLKELGLNETEVGVYLTLLPIGQASASILAYQTKQDRSTVRYACNKLVKKGLLRIVKKGSTTIYEPESPYKLNHLLEKEGQKLKRKQEMANRIISELTSMMDPAAIMPKICFFEGLSRVQESYLQMLKKCESGQISAIFSVDEAMPSDLNGFFVQSYTPVRVEKGIKVRNICLDNPQGQFYKEYDEQDKRETRFLAKNEMPTLNAIINFFDGMVHYVGFNEHHAFAMVIEDIKMSTMVKTMFEALWERSGANNNQNTPT